MVSDVEHNCPHCGKAINPAKMLGAVMTPKKVAANKRNGQRLKEAYEELRRIKGSLGGAGKVEMEIIHNRYEVPARPPAQFGKLVDCDVSPKPTTLAEKKQRAMDALAEASNARLRRVEGDLNDLSDIPRAPFDFEQDGEKYRVRAEKSGLGLYWVGEDAEVRKRALEQGEMEKLWERRIK